MTKLLLEACVPQSNPVSPRNRQVLGVPVGTAKAPSLARTGRRGPRLGFWPVLLNLNKDDRDLKQRAEAKEPDVCKGRKQIWMDSGIPSLLDLLSGHTWWCSEFTPGALGTLWGGGDQTRVNPTHCDFSLASVC